MTSLLISLTLGHRFRAAAGFLALGAATTFGIAWASALLIELPESRRVWGYTFADGALWGVNRIDAPGGTLVEWVYTPWVQPQGGTGEPTSDDVLVAMGALVPSRGVRMEDVPAWGRPRVAEAEAAGNRVAHEARGWPMRAVWCTVAGDRVRGAIESPVRGRAANPLTGSTLLAWRPMWPGFAVNTVVYAAGWGGAIMLVGAARRRIRAGRGRCPRCGYDLRANPGRGCPECGWNR